MEYLIVVLFGFLIATGSKEEPKPVTPEPIGPPKPVLSEKPTYQPNYYVHDAENGYYTSDLSARTEPVEQVTVNQNQE